MRLEGDLVEEDPQLDLSPPRELGELSEEELRAYIQSRERFVIEGSLRPGHYRLYE